MTFRFAALATCCPLLIGAVDSVAPAMAQEQPQVQVIINHVKPAARRAYEAWVADYRALVERLVTAGKMTTAQTCAFHSWRVLMPPAELADAFVAADLPLDYVFIFDPVVEGVSYSLMDYLVAGVGQTEAATKLTAYQQMLASAPTVLDTVPSTKTDVRDRSGVC